MKQFGHCKFSIKQVAVIVLPCLCVGPIFYCLLTTLTLKNTLILHILYMVYALVLSIMAGLISFQSIRLKNYKKLLSVYKKQASTDKLTELHNRSYLDPFLENEIRIADKFNKQVSVIMIDMDHFKEINDKHGHIVGDYVLTIFAQIVLKCIRKTDRIARYGGDEFIVVLPCTDTMTAHSVAERIRQEVSTTYIPPIEGISISSISCSVGVSTYPVLCNNRHNLIKTSDLALYEAKHAGRNCTIVYNGDLTHAC